MSLLQAVTLKFLYTLKSAPLSHLYFSIEQNLLPGAKSSPLQSNLLGAKSNAVIQRCHNYILKKKKQTREIGQAE